LHSSEKASASDEGIYCDDLCWLKLLPDAVADQLIEADVVVHLKQILSDSHAVVELMHNALMLVKSLSTIGLIYFFGSDQRCADP